MPIKECKILTEHLDVEGISDIEVYKQHSGYQAIEKVFKGMSPDDVIATVQDSALAGRGGAWFNTGMKWSFMPKEPDGPSYLCVNCDESEPGTFKDRHLIAKNPHQLLEGVIISAYAIRASAAYIRFRQLNKVVPDHCLYQCPWFGSNTLGMRQMAGIVIGHLQTGVISSKL